jgi:hypothetical protein
MTEQAGAAVTDRGMQAQGGTGGGAARADSAPARTQARRAIVSYDSYRDAERAVDYLADQRFPVQRVQIVGRDLQTVEQVTGRMGWGQAALRGAGQGALLGLLFGWIFGLFNWVDPIVSSLTLALYGLVYGAIIGALLGLLFYAMTGGRRDFASISGMRAGRYEILVDDEVADEAARLLASQPAGGTSRR